MRPERSRMTVIALVLLGLAVVVVVSLALAFPSSQTGPQSRSATNSTLGLKLVVYLNSSVIRQGQTENLTVAVFNIRKENNTVPEVNSCLSGLCSGVVSGQVCPETEAVSA